MEVFSELLAGLQGFLSSHGLSSPLDIRGQALAWEKR
jgi:hypothetical protein